MKYSTESSSSTKKVLQLHTLMYWVHTSEEWKYQQKTVRRLKYQHWLFCSKKPLRCTCCDDVPSFLKCLIIKMMPSTEHEPNVHVCVAEVYDCNGDLEVEGGEDRRGGICRAGPLHGFSRQAVVNLKTNKDACTDLPHYGFPHQNPGIFPIQRF